MPSRPPRSSARRCDGPRSPSRLSLKVRRIGSGWSSPVSLETLTQSRDLGSIHDRLPAGSRAHARRRWSLTEFVPTSITAYRGALRRASCSRPRGHAHVRAQREAEAPYEGGDAARVLRLDRDRLGLLVPNANGGQLHATAATPEVPSLLMHVDDVDFDASRSRSRSSARPYDGRPSCAAVRRSARRAGRRHRRWRGQRRLQDWPPLLKPCFVDLLEHLDVHHVVPELHGRGRAREGVHLVALPHLTRCELVRRVDERKVVGERSPLPPRDDGRRRGRCHEPARRVVPSASPGVRTARAEARTRGASSTLASLIVVLSS